MITYRNCAMGRDDTVLNFLISLKRTVSCVKFLVFEILAYRINFIYRWLMGSRQKIIIDEIRIAKVKPQDNILFIGCGFLPSTPMILREYTKADITTIEKNKKIVKFAREYLQRKGIFDGITIVHGDGRTYSVREFDIIFIATNVWPIDGVLLHLSDQMKVNARLICRDIQNDIQIVLEHGDLMGKFRVKSMVDHPAGPNYKSLLLVKK